ncbi:demethoxyubiquinone hydroxylase family protein [Pseudomonas aeruginosa]
MGSRPSVLNPISTACPSASVRRRAGQRPGPAWGFCRATEDQVCKHLDEHLAQIPQEDRKSRAILEQMRIDEEQHSSNALAAGGLRFPAPVSWA